MKIFIPKKAKEGLGGGWTFTSNFIKAGKGKIETVNVIDNCDIFFIPGPTLVEKDEVEIAKNLGKKIVLRVDNIPRNSRNRNTGTSKLYKFAQMADLVIYQSQWAKDFIKPFIKKDGPVILNGVDTNIFKPEGNTIVKDGCPQYLYIRSSRDETKRWEKAWYIFLKEYFRTPESHLWIVGKFGDENIEYNFDLFGGAEKRYKYFGMVDNPVEIAKIMRSASNLLCPFSNEACSNTVNEAMACGLEIVSEKDGGGIPEQLEKGVISIEEMFKQYEDAFSTL